MRRHRRPLIDVTRHSGRNFYREQISQRLVDGGKVLGHYSFTPLAISFLDGFLNGGNGLFARQDIADGKETSLHDRIDSRSHSGLAGDSITIDDIKLEFLAYDFLLDASREMVPNFLRTIRTVQQKCCSALSMFENINSFQEPELMASDKARLGDQITGANGPRTKTKVGGRQRSRL